MHIGILLNARLGSKRLLEKHTKSIGGEPALGHLIDRIKTGCACSNSSTLTVIIATGSQEENEGLRPVAEAKDVAIAFADPHNIPKRHVQIAEAYKLDGVISIDGDDLLTSPTAINAAVKALERGEQLVRTEGLPLGMNVLWAYTPALLAASLKAVPVDAQLETGWGRIFPEDRLSLIHFEVPGADRIRATLDYEEDLQFFRAVYEHCPENIRSDDSKLIEWILNNAIHELNFSRHEDYLKNFAREKAAEDVKLHAGFSQRLHTVIPGGAHTYSRGDDQYPQNAPAILERGKGAYVWAPTGQRLLDYGMALRAINIGYAEPCINQAAIRQIEHGNNLTRASTIELEAAELLVSLIDSVDMVKFTKNGSTATSAAVKLARAFTGRELIGRCTQHAFFSYDDWFIGSTALTKGIPEGTIAQTKYFNYNDITSLEALIASHPEQLACVILEPAAAECPAIAGQPLGCCQKEICERQGQENYLQQVQSLCRKHGIVFILDEMITGFRWHMRGAQAMYGVKPDLCSFGKAMANGFSVAAVGGKREIMELGGINRPKAERVFLLSTTHGAEMSGLGAFVETVRFLECEQVIPYLWHYGARFVAMMRACAEEAGIQKYVTIAGPVVSPYYVFYDHENQVSLELRTLFQQELIKHGVLMPWMAFCFRHGDKELEMTQRATAEAMQVVKKALDEGVEHYLVGPAVKPVFRKYN